MDTTYAEMSIGGQLPAGAVEGFVKALTLDGQGPVSCKVEDLMRVTDERGHFSIQSDEAPGGQFEHLESFCVEHGLPFLRSCGAVDEYLPETVYWRPGMDDPRTLLEDSQGRILVPRDELREYPSIEAAIDAYTPPDLPLFEVIDSPIDKAARRTMRAVAMLLAFQTGDRLQAIELWQKETVLPWTAECDAAFSTAMTFSSEEREELAYATDAAKLAENWKALRAMEGTPDNA